jgi:hypothetical protein
MLQLHRGSYQSEKNNSETCHVGGAAVTECELQDDDQGGNRRVFG